jgi:hypothetical protein
MGPSEEERQRQVEKLLDWELNKQLTWAVVFLSTIVGLIAILGSNLLAKSFVAFIYPLLTIDLRKIPFVIIYFAPLSFSDIGFYRILLSLANMGEIVASLPSELQSRQLKRHSIALLCRTFVRQIDEKKFCVKMWLFALLTAIGDLLFVLAFIFVSG